MLSTNESNQEHAVATELQHAYKSAVRSAMPNYMKLRHLDHAGLDEVQERIGRLRSKWDTRHTFLCEQQQEASQIIKSLVSPRVLMTRHGQQANRDDRPGRLCVLTSFAGAGTGVGAKLRQTTVYPDALFQVNNTILSMKPNGKGPSIHNGSIFKPVSPASPSRLVLPERTASEVTMTRIYPIQPIQPKNLGVMDFPESGWQSPRARAHQKVSSNTSHSLSDSWRAPPALQILQSCKGMRAGAKEASSELGFKNAHEKQGKHTGTAPVALVGFVPSKTLPRLTPGGAQQSPRNLLLQSSATSDGWSAEKFSFRNEWSTERSSLTTSKTIPPSPFNIQLSDASNAQKTQMDALRQLKEEVMNIVSLAAVTPRVTRQSPRNNPKGSWVPRFDLLRERTQHVNRQTMKELEQTEEFLGRWSTAHPTTGSKAHPCTGGTDLSVEGDSVLAESKACLTEWIKVCDTYPVSPRRWKTSIEASSDGGLMKMLELGPDTGGNRRVVDLCPHKPLSVQTETPTGSMPVAGFSGQAPKSLSTKRRRGSRDEPITSPRGMARSTAKWHVMRIVPEDKRSESANSNRGQVHFQDEKSLQDFGGGMQFKDSEGAHSTDTRDMGERGAARFGSAWSGSRATTGMTPGTLAGNADTIETAERHTLPSFVAQT